jgi:hypothetical protein
MMFGSVWMLFAFVAVILLIYLLSGGTKRSERGGRTVCTRCSTEQPYNAQYCGRCGQKLE